MAAMPKEASSKQIYTLNAEDMNTYSYHYLQWPCGNKGWWRKEKQQKRSITSVMRIITVRDNIL